MPNSSTFAHAQTRRFCLLLAMSCWKRIWPTGIFWNGLQSALRKLSSIFRAGSTMSPKHLIGQPASVRSPQKTFEVGFPGRTKSRHIIFRGENGYIRSLFLLVANCFGSAAPRQGKTDASWKVAMAVCNHSSTGRRADPRTTSGPSSAIRQGNDSSFSIICKRIRTVSSAMRLVGCRTVVRSKHGHSDIATSS